MSDTRWDMDKLDELMEGTKLQRFVGQGSLLVLWHGGATFNVFDAHTLQEVDVFTVYGDDKGNPIQSIDEAAKVIDEWWADQDV